MVQLFILKGTTWVELEMGTEYPAFTYQANDIADTKDRRAAYSQSFRLPNTAANMDALEYIQSWHSTTRMQYKTYTASLQVNSVEMLDGGMVLKIQSVQPDSVEVQIVSAAFNLFNSLKTIDFTQVPTQAKCSGDGDPFSVVPRLAMPEFRFLYCEFGGVYFPVIYNGFECFSAYRGNADAGSMQYQSAVPAFDVYYMLSYLLGVQGWTLKPDTDPKGVCKKLFILPVDYKGYKDLGYIRTVQQKSGTTISENHSGGAINGDITYSTYNKCTALFHAGGEGDPAKMYIEMTIKVKNERLEGESFYMKDESQTIIYKDINGNPTGKRDIIETHYMHGVFFGDKLGDKDRPNLENFTEFIESIKSYFAGKSGYYTTVKETVGLITIEYNIIKMRFYFSGEIKILNTTANEFHKYYYIFPENKNKDFAHLYIGTMFNSKYVTCTAKFVNENLINKPCIPDGQFCIANNLGIKNGLEFLKLYMQIFGYTPVIDYDTKTLYLRHFSTLASNKSKARDWSEKLVPNSYTKTYSLDGFAQVNTIRKKERRADKFQDYTTFAVDDTNLQKENTYIDANLLSCNWESKGYHCDYYAVDEKNERKYQKLNAPALFTWDCTNPTAAEQAFSAWNIKQEYQPLIDMVTVDAMTVECDLWLTQQDVVNFNHFVPVYLTQFGQYFYVQKITNFVPNKPTRVTLIKINI